VLCFNDLVLGRGLLVPENAQSLSYFHGALNWQVWQIAFKHGNVFQFGRLSFFKSAANRGSVCKLLSTGSAFVPTRPLSRWA
jgi:hypothetical protein